MDRNADETTRRTLRTLNSRRLSIAGLAAAMMTLLAVPGPDGQVAHASPSTEEARLEARFDPDLENELLDRVWPTACQRWRQDDEPFDAGAHASRRA